MVSVNTVAKSSREEIEDRGKYQVRAYAGGDNIFFLASSDTHKTHTRTSDEALLRPRAP